jgi:hypothetical protein
MHTQNGGMRVLTTLHRGPPSAHIYAARALSLLSRDGEKLRTSLVSAGGVQLALALARSTDPEAQVCICVCICACMYVCIHVHVYFVVYALACAAWRLCMRIDVAQFSSWVACG